MEAVATNVGTDTERGNERSSQTAQFLYEVFYGGAIGGSTIALLFLALDSFAGRPLFTPSAIGTALFTGAVPDTAAEIRLDMVAYYSVVHFGAFLLLGGVTSKMCRWTGLSRSSPGSVAGLVFLLLSAAFFGAGWLVMPGIGSAIGTATVLGANAVTAAAMAVFFYREHRSDIASTGPTERRRATPAGRTESPAGSGARRARPPG